MNFCYAQVALQALYLFVCGGGRAGWRPQSGGGTSALAEGARVGGAGGRRLAPLGCRARRAPALTRALSPTPRPPNLRTCIRLLARHATRDSCASVAPSVSTDRRCGVCFLVRACPSCARQASPSHLPPPPATHTANMYTHRRTKKHAHACITPLSNYVTPPPPNTTQGTTSQPPPPPPAAPPATPPARGGASSSFSARSATGSAGTRPASGRTRWAPCVRTVGWRRGWGGRVGREGREGSIKRRGTPPAGSLRASPTERGQPGMQGGAQPREAHKQACSPAARPACAEGCSAPPAPRRGGPT